MKLGKISKDGFQDWWNNENPVENLSAFSVYLRLEDETHLTVEFVHDEEDKYRVNTIR